MLQCNQAYLLGNMILLDTPCTPCFPWPRTAWSHTSLQHMGMCTQWGFPMPLGKMFQLDMARRLRYQPMDYKTRFHRRRKENRRCQCIQAGTHIPLSCSTELAPPSAGDTGYAHQPSTMCRLGMQCIQSCSPPHIRYHSSTQRRWCSAWVIWNYRHRPQWRCLRCSSDFPCTGRMRHPCRCIL